jgi:Anticodon binding domain
VMHTLRLALTGAERGMGMHYVVAALERHEALARCSAETRS